MLPLRLFRAATILATVSMTSLVGVTPALAVECPAPHPLKRPGVIRESPAQIHALSSLLASGDAENRIASPWRICGRAILAWRTRRS
jgi:hypothetical protein